MDLFGFLRSIFSYPIGNRGSENERSGNDGVTQFQNSDWIEDEEGRDDDIYGPATDRRRFGSDLFNHTSENMQRFFEQQMTELIRSFTEMTDIPIFGSISTDVIPPIEDSSSIFDGSSYSPTRSRSLRDEFLKPEYPRNPVNREPNIKSDNDLDGQLHSDQLYSFLKRNTHDDDSTTLSPYNEQPSTSGSGFSYSFGQSMSSKTVRHPDGSVETSRTMRDSQGNEETTITLQNNSEVHTRIVKKDAKGNITEIEEILPITYKK